MIRHNLTSYSSIFSIFLVLLFASCVPKATPTSSNYFVDRSLGEKETLALIVGSRLSNADDLDFNNFLYEHAIVEFYSHPVFLRQFDLLDRHRVETLMKEQGFSNSGVVDFDTGVEIGRILGVKKIAFVDILQATVEKTGTAFLGIGEQNYKITVSVSMNIVEVETGLILASGMGKKEGISKSGSTSSVVGNSFKSHEAIFDQVPAAINLTVDNLAKNYVLSQQVDFPDSRFKPSIRPTLLHSEELMGVAKFGDVLCQLDKRLSKTEFSPLVYYPLTSQEGIVVVTPIIEIELDGTPKQGKKFFRGIASYLQVFVTGQVGKFRMLVFVIADKSVPLVNKFEDQPLFDDAVAWSDGGVLSVDSNMEQIPYTDKHKVGAIIYEFEQHTSSSETPFVNHKVESYSARDILRSLNVWEVFSDFEGCYTNSQ